MLAEERLAELARAIRLIVIDIDGVMTDGGLYFDDKGMCMKRFHVQDGIGIKLAQAAGLEVAIVTGDITPIVTRRAEILGITECHQGPQRKNGCVDEIRLRKGLEWSQVAFIGDDWIDIAAMRRVGLPIAVRNAQPEVKDVAALVTKLEGGRGAVREAIRFILTAQGAYQTLLDEWRD